MARDRDRVAMDVGNAKQPKTPRSGTEWPLAGTPRLPAHAWPAPPGVVWPKLHEDGRGPLNLGLPPPHSKKAAAAQVKEATEGAEGAYTLKEAMRLTVTAKPWNEAGQLVESGRSGLLVAPQLGTARPPRTAPPCSGLLHALDRRAQAAQIATRGCVVRRHQHLPIPRRFQPDQKLSAPFGQLSHPGLITFGNFPQDGHYDYLHSHIATHCTAYCLLAAGRPLPLTIQPHCHLLLTAHYLLAAGRSLLAARAARLSSHRSGGRPRGRGSMLKVPP